MTEKRRKRIGIQCARWGVRISPLASERRLGDNNGSGKVNLIE